MNEEDKVIINSFKFYDRDELEDLTKEFYLENKQLKEQLEASEKVRKEAIEYINVTEYSGIVGLNSNGIKEFWFIKDLLSILKEEDNNE